MNVIIIYLEDTEDGHVLVSAEALGNPEGALDLANEVLSEILDAPDTNFLRSSVFTRPAQRVQ